MSEPQLERSVLESKEREELFAIANALGTKPISRARKSDLVNQILEATGVEIVSTPPAVKPRRATRTRRTPADAATPDQLPLTPPDEAPAEAPADPPPAAAPTVTRRTGAASGIRRSAASTAGRRTDSPAGTAPSESPTPPAPVEVVAAIPPPPPPPPSTRTSRPPGGTGANGRGAEPSRVDTPRSDAPRTEASRVDASGSDAPRTETPRPETSRTETSRPEPSRSDAPRSDNQPRPTPPRPVEARRSEPAVDAGRNGNGNGNGSAGRADEVGSGGSRAPGGEHRADAQGGDDHNGAPGGPARFEEPGNRRSRRRRGRERTERPERELPGQVPEQAFSGEPVQVSGFLDLREEGYGFLRTAGYLAGFDDVYVSISQVRRFSLRRGDQLEGGARPAGGNEKYPALLRVDTVSGLAPDEARARPRFDALTPVFPDSPLALEAPGDPADLTARIVDLLAPIGKGQRGLIVSAPKAGKTTIVKQIAGAIEVNHPDVHLIVLLVDERPEDVTDMRRAIKGEVVASTFDRPAEEHTQIAELVLERAKRMVELGRDVVIVLDGITRLTRAYNLSQPATGRVMSGGIDTGALYPPKKFFGAARNIEEGGSLTILATALVETGSRMDEVIFEEFRGTGNMELRLDRKLAERRVYPAIDVDGSSTRHEELLLPEARLQQVWELRRALQTLGDGGNPAAGAEALLARVRATGSNDQLLDTLAELRSDI